MHPNLREGKITETRPPARLRILIGLLGAYGNAVAYGFVYGEINHEFDLPLVNWLRDPSLYPGDPLTAAFARYPAQFWRLVAYLSHWMSIEHVLLVFFLLTKVLFFAALAELLAARVKDARLVACAVLAVALSPFLNGFTPFGTSDVLSSVQTNTPLAIALLVWGGVFLVEGRWVRAAIVSGLAAYVNALFLVYTLFAFAAFAVIDWRRSKGRILLAAFVGAAISLSWLAFSPGTIPASFPSDYLQALEMLYPGHFRLGVQHVGGLVGGTGLVLAALLMVGVAAKGRLGRQRRLELLAAAYLVPVLLGALFGEFFLTPRLARLQLLRADSFLMLYSILLIQTYGASLLLAPPTENAGATLCLGAFAILLPLSDDLLLLPALFLGMLLWTDPRNRFEGFCRVLGRSWASRGGILLVSVTGIVLAARADANWTATAIILLTTIAGEAFLCGSASPFLGARTSKLAAAICGLTLLMLGGGTIPRPSSLWNPILSPKPEEADWFEVQRWAKANTPRDAHFLVPTYPCGFRAFSERSSWGEWKDGNGPYLDPAFAEIYLRRMEALGLRSDGTWNDFGKMQTNYRRQSWQRLLAIAGENHLSYIIQFRDVKYPVAPVFANHSFAVYKAPP